LKHGRLGERRMNEWWNSLGAEIAQPEKLNGCGEGFSSKSTSESGGIFRLS